MTTRNEARGALYNRLITVFAPAASFTPGQITFDNEDFEIPTNTPWLRASFRESVRTQETLDRPTDRVFQSRARLICQIFTPYETGMALSDSLVQTLRSTFEGAQVPGFDLYVFGVDVREIGNRGPAEQYDQTNVEINFVYRETR